MRRPILTANWKMHKTASEAADFVRALLPLVARAEGRDIVLAPSATALDRVAQALGAGPVLLAGQNVHSESQGAFTGEISAAMLADLGCCYCIVGHSERRALFHETSSEVARKAAALMSHSIRPIVCIGETLEERATGRTAEVVGEQLDDSLQGLPADRAGELVVAYEPVWAIGTGQTATPKLAQEVHGFIRDRLRARFGSGAESVRIQYGGSVKPDNIAALMAEPDIDGALVGGASLQAESFARIVHFDRLESPR